MLCPTNKRAFLQSSKNSSIMSANGTPSAFALSAVIPCTSIETSGISHPSGFMINERSFSFTAHAYCTIFGNSAKSTSHFAPFGGNPVVSQSNVKTSFIMSFISFPLLSFNVTFFIIKFHLGLLYIYNILHLQVVLKIRYVLLIPHCSTLQLSAIGFHTFRC